MIVLVLICIAVWESKIIPFLKNCRFHRDTYVNQIKYNHYYKNYTDSQKEMGERYYEEKTSQKSGYIFFIGNFIDGFYAKGRG